jgi:hypothetical protein
VSKSELKKVGKAYCGLFMGPSSMSFLNQMFANWQNSATHGYCTGIIIMTTAKIRVPKSQAILVNLWLEC